MMLPMLVVFLIGGVELQKAIAPGESFDAHHTEVRIKDSELQFGELRSGATVAVVGTIYNDSKISWKSVTLEVQFYDKSHKLIDTKQSKQWSEDLTLPAKGESAFKISQPREFKQEDYASYEVRIVDARDRQGFLQWM